MAKHLTASPQKKKKKSSGASAKVLPRLIEWKAPPKRSFHYQREFSRMEAAPVLAAMLLFLVAWAVPVNAVIKWIAFVITALVAGFSLLRRCFISLLHLKWPDEDCLVLVASLLVFLAGRYAAAAFIVILGRIVELTEAYILTRSARGVEALRDVLPESAHVEEEFGLIDIVPEELREGDVFVVQKGETIPVDGEIIEGASTVDSSAFGGKETPEPVSVGHEVLSGSINVANTLRIVALRSFEESALAKHLQSLEAAEREKTRIEERIEFYCSILTPAMLLIAVCVGLIAPLFHGNWPNALTKAAIVLLLTSPSSLITAVPVAFLGGMACASHSGMRLKVKSAMEALSHVKTIVFGKTGTITDGKYKITEIDTVNVSEAELLRVAAAAESLSRHPIAMAIKRAAGWSAEQDKPVLEVEELPGRGVSAFFDGKHVYVGNAEFLEEHGIWFKVPNRSGTAIHVAVENNYWGYILLNDKIREGAFDTVEELRSLGLRNIVMLTGDVRSAASKLARSLNFDMVKTELTPEDKLSAVKYLRKSLGKGETLAYVGDGFHDADAFYLADAGIALNAMGDSEAEAAADVILMDEDIMRVSHVVKIAAEIRQLILEDMIGLGSVRLILLVFSITGLLSLVPAAFLNAVFSCLAALNALRGFTVE